MLASLGALALLHAGGAHARSDVGVSVSIDQPGFYGRVDIGDRRPELIYAEPLVIERTRYTEVQRPIYLHVPPGHYKRWSRYCGRYRACAQPVYFVHGPMVAARPGWRADHHHRHWREERRERWHDRRHHHHGHRHDHHRDDHHGHGRRHGRD